MLIFYLSISLAPNYYADGQPTREFHYNLTARSLASPIPLNLIYSAGGQRPSQVIVSIKRLYAEDNDIEYVNSTYNSAGQETRENTYDSDETLISYQIYTYDATGQLTRRDYYDSDETLISSYQTYAYDATGQLTRRDYYDSDETLTSYDNYTYNAAGQLTRINYYHSDGALNLYDTYTYNALGQLILEDEYVSDGTLCEFSVYAYGGKKGPLPPSTPSRLGSPDSCSSFFGGGLAPAPDPAPTDPVSNFSAIPADSSLLLSWTNPARGDIAGFNITRFDTNNPGDVNWIILDSANELLPEATVSYTISGLSNDNDYTVTVVVLYADGSSAASESLNRRPGVNTDGDDLPDSTDNCPSVSNSDQTDTDNNNIGDACDPDFGGSPPPAPPVSNFSAIPADSSLLLSWTNPARGDIAGFNITRFDTNNPGDVNWIILDSANELLPEATVSYTISGLSNDNDYTVTVVVLYADGSSAASESLNRRPGVNTDGDDLPDSTDNCPSVSNSDQTDTDNNNIGDACDPDFGGSPPPAPPVSNFSAIPADSSLLLSWINPARDDIAGFNITRFDTNNPNDEKTITLTSADNVNLSASAVVSYTISGLSNDNDYTVTVVVLYADGTSSVLISVQGTAGADPDGDGPGGDPNGGGDATFPAVTDVQTTVNGNTITVSWTNPNPDGQDEITGFNVAWVNDANTTDRGEMELDATVSGVLVVPGTQSMYTITDLTYDATYEITVAVRYADGTSVDSAPVQGKTGTNPDIDGDGIVNTEDADDDNNGLIEIHNLDQLALLRDDLNGNGTDDGNIDEITSVGSVGCPAAGCSGYELTRSLNFSDAASYADGTVNTAWTTGSGWTPIGSCSVAKRVCTPYTAMFDGGGYAIVDMFITAEDTVIGVGLFGVFNGSLQNLHLRNATVRGGAIAVGGLVGNGENARYENLSVTDISVMSPSATSVGGLVGNGVSTTIRYASVSGLNVDGDDNTGGLSGDSADSTILYSYVSGGNVSGGSRVGGLLGSVANSNIRYTYASGVDVFGSGNQIGGLIGYGQGAFTRYTYVSGGSVTGDAETGGLIGDGQLGQIYYSYAATGQISSSSSSSFIGGLIGQIVAAPTVFVTASYWDNQTTKQSTSSANLGVGQTTAQLKSPLTFEGIYADWGNFWCNPNIGAEMTSTTDLSAPWVRVWDLGTISQYPALNCMPLTPAQQRQ